MKTVQKRELIWMSQPNNRSSSEVDALGLSGALDGMDCCDEFSCCSYCQVCPTFCLCDSLEICITKFCWNN
jgi:hypothetical protein